MCGIVGISLNSEITEAYKQIGLYILKDLMIENTTRGKDSTGILYINNTKNKKRKFEIVKGLVSGDKAQEFILPEKELSGILGHVRYATVGNKKSYKNIHPFDTEKYIGVHNGTLINHLLIKDHFNIESQSTCDSEVIYRMFDRFGTDAFKYFEGSYALAYVKKDNNKVINVVSNGARPMVFIILKDVFVLFGSIAEETLKDITPYFDEQNISYKIENIVPGKIYKIKNGRLIGRYSYNDIINIITPQQGEIIYKLAKNGINKDLYQKTIPVWRRLNAPKPKADLTKAATTQNRSYNKGYNNNTPTYTSKKMPPLETASNKTTAWLTNCITNLTVQFRKRLKYPAEAQAGMLNIDVLGTLIDFKDTTQVLDFLYKESICANAQNPTFSVLPSESPVTSIWMPYIGQMYLFLTSLMLSDSMILYSKRTYKKGFEIKPEEILAASMCGIKHSDAIPKVSKHIHDTMIKSGILSDSILYENSMTRDGFVNYIQKNKILPYSISCPFTSSFTLGRLSKASPYNETSLVDLCESNFKSERWNGADVSLFGRYIIAVLSMQGLLEAITMGDPLKRIFHRTGPIKTTNKIDPIIKQMYASFKLGTNKDLEDIYSFFSKLKYIKTTSLHSSLLTELDIIETGVKSAVATTFGEEVSTFNLGIAQDIFYLANNMYDTKTVEKVAILNIDRALAIRNFFINGEVLDKNLGTTVTPNK